MAQKTEQPPASPTLIPALPSPIPPTTSSAATSEELGFFDRAKKAISNKNTFNEFLKLCNLFSQDLVDRTVLIHRARAFIGTHPELMKWFQEFIGYDEKDVIVENKARIPGGRVSLSNCRGLGPSYRLLPKRVSSSFSYCSYCPYCRVRAWYCEASHSLFLLGVVQSNISLSISQETGLTITHAFPGFDAFLLLGLSVTAGSGTFIAFISRAAGCAYTTISKHLRNLGDGTREKGAAHSG